MRVRDDNKEEAILQATKELLNEVGFAETSMSKIAKRAGVSAATIYVYFDGKDDMLRALYLGVKKKLAMSTIGQVDETLPVRENVARAMRGYLRFILDNQEDYLFLEQFSNSPVLQNLCIEEELPSFGAFQVIIDKGREEGILRPVDVRLIFAYCALPMAQLAKDSMKSGTPIDSEEIQSVIDMSWNAIRG